MLYFCKKNATIHCGDVRNKTRGLTYFLREQARHKKINSKLTIFEITFQFGQNFWSWNMNPPNDPPEVNVNGQTSSVERPQTSAAIAAKSSTGKNMKRSANFYIYEGLTTT